jgi:uncharacterized protein (TIGR02996 family)
VYTSEAAVEEAFLQGLHAEPNDETTWLALADWLEENDQGPRGELVRLVRQLRTLPVMKRTRRRAALEDRVATLLAAGVRPVVPEVVNSIGMRLALIPPGRFRMGSPAHEANRDSDEGPAHEVEISRPFYLGVYHVTQAQWQRVMGNDPSYFSASGGGMDDPPDVDTSAFPVEQVSWQDAVEFLDKLSALPQEKKAGFSYRLPTEAEWEYACRAGTLTPFHFGSSASSHQANFVGRDPYGGAEKGPYLDRPCPVGSFRPNALGLYDTHGNVWEWCSDFYDRDYYGESPRLDPTGPSAGVQRVIRGGSWDSYGWGCRAALRDGWAADDRTQWMGLRAAAVRTGA